MFQVFKKGTLRFWGDWFGRPYDNYHQVVKSELSDNQCVLYFDHGEKCTVIDPGEIVSTENEFYIKDATKVRWEWFSYGMPQESENLKVIEYERKSDSIVLKKEGTHSKNINLANLNAVEIIGS